MPASLASFFEARTKASWKSMSSGTVTLTVGFSASEMKMKRSVVWAIALGNAGGGHKDYGCRGPAVAEKGDGGTTGPHVVAYPRSQVSLWCRWTNFVPSSHRSIPRKRPGARKKTIANTTR